MRDMCSIIFRNKPETRGKKWLQTLFDTLLCGCIQRVSYTEALWWSSTMVKENNVR